MKRYIILASIAVIFAASCSKQMNYNEYNIYDKDYIALNFGNVGGFMTDIYNTVEYDFGNYSSGAMLASASDESKYSIMGNAIEDFYNGAWSPSNPKANTWKNMYAGIATCNTVLTEMQGLDFEELKLNDDYIQQMHRYENYQYECRFMLLHPGPPVRWCSHRGRDYERRRDQCPFPQQLRPGVQVHSRRVQCHQG